ncbi:MAG: dehydratase [Candidatus Marinimicrobia bacterium]|nr:dehydratase [Candidatus Neomarinimicrobiota bacterium]|tara:strand:- start:1689 stop:2108 length:420 start_codon:yes stop_codon:yes gene_type:complete
MNKWDCRSAKIGDNLPELLIETISRTKLALYAGASGDHNPIHIDTDYTKRIGLSDVIAHGMLIMGYLGRVLTNNLNQNQILEYGVQFSSITNIGDKLACSGIVKEILNNKKNKIIKLELKVKDQNNDTKLKGYSLIKTS